MQSGWQRWIPLTGILFIVFVVVGFALATGPEDTGDDAKLLAWYADSGNRTGAVIGAYALALAGVAMLLFINRLRTVVAEAEPGEPVFAPFILSAGTVFVVAIVIAGATFAAVPAGVSIGDNPAPTNADLLRFLPSVGFGALLVLGMFPLIFAMLTTAYASMRFGIFPSWFNWLTIVCAVVLLFAVEFIPLIALLIWIIAATIVLMKRQPGSVERLRTEPAS